jgi:electron transfer flavoprotein beta subunit
MKIYVCVKHVPDSAATITIEGRKRIDERVTFLLNPYDENAVEAAVQLKAQVADGEIVAVTLGKAGAADTLRSALAMGADRGIHIESSDAPDSLLTAQALAAAMNQDGAGDIIFTGKVAIDSEGCQTMFRIAAALDWPVVNNVSALRLEGRTLTLECELEAGGRQILKAPLPCVIGTAKALNQPRYPTLPAIMKARKKAISSVPLESLKPALPDAGMELLQLKPALERRRGTILSGSPDTAVAELIRLLREEAKVI